MSKVTEFLKFWKDFFQFSPRERKMARQIATEELITYRQGIPTEDGQDLYEFVTDEDMVFIGFVPFISYIKENSRVSEELEALWVHPFSQYTLLFFHKRYHMMVMVNSNLDFNDSKLRKIVGNEKLKVLQGIAGITG